MKYSKSCWDTEGCQKLKITFDITHMQSPLKHDEFSFKITIVGGIEMFTEISYGIFQDVNTFTHYDVV